MTEDRGLKLDAVLSYKEKQFKVVFPDDIFTGSDIGCMTPHIFYRKNQLAKSKLNSPQLAAFENYLNFVSQMYFNKNMNLNEYLHSLEVCKDKEAQQVGSAEEEGKSAKSIKKINKLLQKAINKINKYAQKWGLKLNIHKTKYMVIANNHNRPSYELSSNLNLEINNQKIEKVRQAMLLGINFDPGLTFESHFNEIINKFSSKLNLLKILSSKHYGLKTKTLTTVYKLTIHSIIQYSMLPYHITRKKIKKKLQIIQNKALKIIFKVNRNTSNKILHAIANISTIEQRLKNLTKNYITRSIDEEIKEIINSNITTSNEQTKSILNCMN